MFVEMLESTDYQNPEDGAVFWIALTKMHNTYYILQTYEEKTFVCFGERQGRLGTVERTDLPRNLRNWVVGVFGACNKICKQRTTHARFGYKHIIFPRRG